MKFTYPLCIGLFAILFPLLNSGCKEENSSDAEIPVTTFYLIRHAEKDRTDSDDQDPELNQQGLGRAMHWAEILDDANIDAIYSTNFERTSMTATPLSVKKEITTQFYNPEFLDIEEFKADNLNKNVLVVGHSNTTPNLVNALIGKEKYGPMDDSDNGSLFIVQLVGDVATDIHLSFNCNCPKRR